MGSRPIDFEPRCTLSPTRHLSPAAPSFVNLSTTLKRIQDPHLFRFMLPGAHSVLLDGSCGHCLGSDLALVGHNKVGSLPCGSAVGRRREVGLQRLPHLLLALQLRVGLAALKAFDDNAVANGGARRRVERLDLVLAGCEKGRSRVRNSANADRKQQGRACNSRAGAQHHGLAHDAAHLRGLEVAEQHHHAALEVLLRHLAHEAADDGAGLFLAEVDGLHKQLGRVRVRLDTGEGGEGR